MTGEPEEHVELELEVSDPDDRFKDIWWSDLAAGGYSLYRARCDAPACGWETERAQDWGAADSAWWIPPCPSRRSRWVTPWREVDHACAGEVRCEHHPAPFVVQAAHPACSCPSSDGCPVHGGTS